MRRPHIKLGYGESIGLENIVTITVEEFVPEKENGPERTIKLFINVEGESPILWEAAKRQAFSDHPMPPNMEITVYSFHGAQKVCLEIKVADGVRLSRLVTDQTVRDKSQTIIRSGNQLRSLTAVSSGGNGQEALPALRGRGRLGQRRQDNHG